MRAPYAGGLADMDLNPAVLSQSSLDFRYIASAIRSNRRLIVAVLLGAIAIGLITTFIQTPRYAATATLQINNQSGRVLKTDDERDQEFGGGAETERFLKTQVDVLKSRSLALRVVQKLNLAGNPKFYLAEEVSQPPVGMTLEKIKLRAANQLMKHLDIVLPRDSRVVKVTYESADKALATAIANAYATEFIEYNLQRKVDSSAYAREFLSKQLEISRQRLEQSERALNEYARQNGLIITRPAVSDNAKNSSGAGTSVTTSSLIQQNTAMNEATAKRVAVESRWGALQGPNLMSAPEVLTNASITGLMTQKAEVEAALGVERAHHLEDYPTVVAKRAQLNSLNAQIQRVARAIRDSVHGEYMAAKQAEAELQQQVRTLKAETLNEQELAVQYGLLTHESDTNRQVYDGLLERFKELNAVAGANLSNVSLVDPAIEPNKPSSPNVLLNIVASILGGILVTAIAVYLKDQFDDSIRVPDDLETKLGVSMLGVIPHAQSNNPLALLDNPKSALSEAFNSLRGALMFVSDKGLPQVMMLTSAQPAEGKSTSSTSLATILAKAGHKVLLIDADLRRPTLHRVTDYDNDRGLSTYLANNGGLADTVRPATQANLFVMTSGPVPQSPTELLSSVRMRQLLDEARREFNVVIIDSPPVLGLADAPLLATQVDGVIMIVEADRSRRGALKTAMRRLLAVRPTVLGGVLTKFDAKRVGGEYYHYYSYNYYQYGDYSGGE
ncbi:polysaccharide biosynthesis tyrosine autokinase [Novosphingobium sp. FSY-8]|uniref:non-specific protein-tyrosine kinase n=1 Tax=Novosphingobium ovatum TaxID=1908523 RepID=A0ABW9XGH5_9SPHN|nr:polysaccharide biosynthesis tyrosine autokinase [Novosphingobium ovatum]NBC37655.1 polysaccharide biosynthesis tyrosine autokinase [Novosphingobium ovatum]